MASAVSPSGSPRSTSGTSYQHVSVMLVDDDADVRDLIAMSLEKHGYTVVTAANGREALTLLETVLPQMIFLDLQMPVMDGHEFRECQRRDRRLLAIPTVVLSGSRLEPQLDLAIAATLHKPARCEELLAIVRTHCARM